MNNSTLIFVNRRTSLRCIHTPARASAGNSIVNMSCANSVSHQNKDNQSKLNKRRANNKTAVEGITNANHCISTLFTSFQPQSMLGAHPVSQPRSNIDKQPVAAPIWSLQLTYRACFGNVGGSKCTPENPHSKVRA